MTWPFRFFAIGAALYALLAVVGGFRLGMSGSVLDAAAGSAWIVLGFVVSLGLIIMIRYSWAGR